MSGVSGLATLKKSPLAPGLETGLKKVLLEKVGTNGRGARYRTR